MKKREPKPMGRPSLGEKRVVSIVLPADCWERFDAIADGKRGEHLRRALTEYVDNFERQLSIDDWYKRNSRPSSPLNTV